MGGSRIPGAAPLLLCPLQIVPAKAPTQEAPPLITGPPTGPKADAPHYRRRIDGHNNRDYGSSTFPSAQLSPAVRSPVDQFNQGGTMYSRIISCTIDTA